MISTLTFFFVRMSPKIFADVDSVPNPLMDMFGSDEKVEPKIEVVAAAPTPSPTATTRATTRGKPAKQLDWESWEDKTARILSKYTTDQRVAVSANFLEEETEKR